MPGKTGPFYNVFWIAQRLAREPGRSKFDLDEAHHLGRDMFDWFTRDELAEQEAVLEFEEPGRFISVAQAKEERGETWEELDWYLFYAVVALPSPTLKRFLERCGHAGVPRLLRELGLDAQERIPEASAADTTNTRSSPLRLAAEKQATKKDSAAGGDLDRAICNALDNGVDPPRNVRWVRFAEDIVRALGKDPKKPDWGHGPKTIERRTKEIQQQRRNATKQDI
jgi:hypothetical protein